MPDPQSRHVQAAPAMSGTRLPTANSWTTTGHLVSPLYLPHLEAVREARTYVQEQLLLIGLDACAQDAGLMVCELAANAVLHARTPFTVHLRPTLEGGIRVEVHDESPLPPVFTAPSATGMSGRGLNLVATMATRWGSHPVVPAAGDPPGTREPLGKIVWFEVEATPVVPVDEASVEELLARWEDGKGGAPPALASRRQHLATGTIVSSLPTDADVHDVVITDIPVAEMLDAKEAMDDLLRQLQLRLLSPGPTDDQGGPEAGDPPADPTLISRPQRALDGDLLIAAHLDAAARGFEFARRQIREQVAHAAARGDAFITLRLRLPGSAARAAAYYRDAVAAAEHLEQLEDLERHGRPGQDPETAGWQSQVRTYYLEEIIAQLSGPAQQR